MGNGINWDEMLSGNFVKLIDGEAKKLILTNWRPQDKFKDDKTDELRKGITFDVMGEDNLEFDEGTKKEYTVTSIRALAKFKPIIEKAEAAGQEMIKVSIVRVGEGKKTEYSIKELE
jgi:hypothetical protein